MVKKPYSPAIPFALSLGIVVGGLLLSQEPPPASGQSLLQWTVSTVAQFLKLSEKTPTLALIYSSNLATLFYAWYFYIANPDARWRVILTSALLFVILFINYAGEQVGGVLADPRSHELFLFREYGVAMFLMFYFYVLDYTKACREASDETTMLYFSSLYISIPALISLILALLFHIYIRAYDGELGFVGSAAFLAGVATIVLFLSNLVFTLIALPWYAKRLKVECAA